MAFPVRSGQEDLEDIIEQFARSNGFPSSGDDELFCVTFDWLTPRPHVIIRPIPSGVKLPGFDSSRSLGEYEKTISGFVEKLVAKADWTFQVVRAINQSVSGPDRDQPGEVAMSAAATSGIVRNYPIIMSIHRGNWVSRHSGLFHAHVCTDISGYLGLIQRMESDRRLPGVIPKKYVTKQWSERPTGPQWVECYVNNVKNSLDKASGYFKDDLGRIKLNGTSKQTLDTRKALIAAVGLRGEQETNVSYHKRFARLGFDLGSACDSREKAAILLKMDEIAAQLLPLMANVVQDTYSHGCHLCISIGEKNNQGEVD